MTTIVFLHGGGMGGRIWGYVATTLPGEGHKLLTPASTGFGERPHLVGRAQVRGRHGRGARPAQLRRLASGKQELLARLSNMPMRGMASPVTTCGDPIGKPADYLSMAGDGMERQRARARLKAGDDRSRGRPQGWPWGWPRLHRRRAGKDACIPAPQAGTRLAARSTMTIAAVG